MTLRELVDILYLLVISAIDDHLSIWVDLKVAHNLLPIQKFALHPNQLSPQEDQRLLRKKRE